MIIDKKKITKSAEHKTAADIAVEAIIWFTIKLIREIEDGRVSTSDDIVSLTDGVIERIKRIKDDSEESEK